MATEVQDIGREIEATSQGVVVTRFLRVTPYEDWSKVADALLGGVVVKNGVAHRIPAARDPAVPWAFCQSVKVTGAGDFCGTTPINFKTLGDYNKYTQGAMVTAVYRSLDFTPFNDQHTGSNGDGAPISASDPQQEIDLSSENWDFNGQMLTIAPENLKFEGSNTTLKNSNSIFNIPQPRVGYKLTRPFVPRIPWAAIIHMIGRINEDSFVVREQVFPEWTLRFDGASASRKTTNRGVKFYELTYNFMFNGNYGRLDEAGDPGFAGWNRKFDPKSGKYLNVLLIADATWKPYGVDNHFKQVINGEDVFGFDLLFHPASGVTPIIAAG